MSESPKGDMLLASLDEFKTYKGIVKSDNDPKLLLMLEFASNMFKEMTRRSFIDYYTLAKIEYYDLYNGGQIFLHEFPLKEVEKVEFSYNGNFTTDPGTGDYLAEITPIELLEYTDYFINKDNDSVLITPENSTIYTAIPGTLNVKITYTAGYKTVPSDIMMAVMDIVDYQREEQFTPRKAFEGMSIENLGFRDSSSSLPAHIKRVMELYRVSI